LRYSGAFPDYQLRLFRNGHFRFAPPIAHEYVVVDGETRNLTHPMDHYSTPTISSRLRKIDYGAPIGAPDRVSMVDFTLAPLRRFWSLYVRRRGYKDGMRGYLWAALNAFEQLIIAAVVWEQHQPASQREISPAASGSPSTRR
jgi:hypothetical protein